MVEYPDWLLSLPPRQVQLEALSRAHWGVCTQDSVDGPVFSRPVPGRSPSVPAKGFGYFLEQRCGKTPTLLAEYTLFRRDYDFKWAVVFSPNAYKQDWQNEAEKFGLPCDAYAADTSNRKALVRWVVAHQSSGGLLAVNYEALGSKDVLSILSDLVGPKTLLAADESINIKTRSSATSKNALTLSKDAGCKRILTGKPITQGAHDLYTQLRFIGEQNGVDPVVFKNTFCVTDGFQGKQIVGVKNEDQLQTILDRCSFNGRKVDWLKTPGRDYFVRHLELLPEQKRLYDSMYSDFMVELANGTVVSADQIITKLIKLQQITSGFIIDEDKVAHDLMPPDRNPKLQELKRLLVEEVDNKVLVVCHYTHSMDLVAAALAEFGTAFIRSEQWHKKFDRDRVAEKARFNGDPATRVMIGQEQALKYGHTLMGSKEAGPCYTTFFYENNYSLNDRSQCEERNQGEGQLQPISIVDFIVSPSDLAPIQALQRKEDVASVILRYARDRGVLPGNLGIYNSVAP